MEAIDLIDGTYSDVKVWPVTAYDGKRIPFDDGVFDAVFSSNVLEHIPSLELHLDEIRRVLKKGGLAIHGMPTPAWRCWTSVVHYPFLVKYVFLSSPGTRPPTHKGKVHLLRRALYAPCHGVIGNVVSEIYYFSKRRWLGVFARSGWIIHEVFVGEIFYTGYSLFGFLLPMRKRRFLSRILGSPCRFYLMRDGRSA